MNIDVMNALEKVLLICTVLEDKNQRHIKAVFIKDIYRFICQISLNQSDSRFDYFSRIYLKGQYLAKDLSITNPESLPECLEIFCSIDKKMLNANVKASKTLIAFFLTLAQSYFCSPSDKKDIDQIRVFNLINQMNGIADEYTMTKERQNPSRPEDSHGSQRGPEIHKKAQNIKDKSNAQAEDEPAETTEELLEKLHSLTGLSAVKKEVDQIVNLVKVRNKAAEFNENPPPLSLHLVFYGNPGTGKTTVARLLGKIYKSLNVLSGGQTIEVDRSRLVAGYVGQTAIKTQQVIDEAMGGILFIDEAYTLTHGKGESDFGQEAVDTILKAMEDHRDDFIVIVAGYPDLMKEFIASNPGLKSRFNQFIYFEDYTPSELVSIFCQMCKTNHLSLGDGCQEYLLKVFEQLYNNRKEDYANARDARNYFEKVIRARANRLAVRIEDVTYEEYITITLDDLIKAEENKSTI